MTETWFSPRQLQEQAQAPDRERMGGGIGSYAQALRTGSIAGTGAASHNLVHAAGRVRQYHHVLRRRSFAAIADIGCGLGVTTAALAELYPDARVIGYELAPDAVDFASKHFPRADFVCQAIDPKTEFGERFDLILCQEFYPFTRTSDWTIQKSFIDMALRHLRPGGVLLIELSERGGENTILANMAALKSYAPLLRRLPFDRLHRNLKIFWLSRWASALARLLRGANQNIVLILENRPDS